MRTQLLHRICDSLQPKFYNEHCYIVKEGDPIDAVFLITEGIVCTCTSNNGDGTNSQHAECLVKGQYFGGKLLEWILTPASVDMRNLSIVPVSSKTLKTHTKVEAFALMAHDFKQILESKLSLLEPEKLQSKAAIRVQRIWRFSLKNRGSEMILIKTMETVSCWIPFVKCTVSLKIMSL